ncbi:MAG: enoyl-CoA hydratase/isomerase family protein [Candidatus Binatia bacterium]|nr:enoyl-CoA hydratase/isomerase family protein [Candidatus Binatia bacterium]
MASEVVYQKRGKVAWLTLCRPAQGNRLTPAMNADLTALSQAVAEDDTVEILVLTGAGDAFCCGLEYLAAEKGAAAAQAIRAQFGLLTCVEAIAALTKPTIAALNGPALGVGLELALACDLRIACENVQCGLPQITEGLIPFCGGTQRLPRLVGQAKAMELILTGESIDAHEAYRIGLVNEVIAAERFPSRVDELLTGLLGKGPIALRLAKEAVQKAMDLTLEQGMRLEEDLYALLQTTQDRAEGVRAFLEKRTPRFTGH